MNEFVRQLRKDPSRRSDEENVYIYQQLRRLDTLKSLREQALRAIAKIVRYEWHNTNEILYRGGDHASCWYILLSGSLFIEDAMFFPHTSFGRRQSGENLTRHNECLVLEPSELIVIDYPDVSSRSVDSALPSSVEGSQHSTFTPDRLRRQPSRVYSDTSSLGSHVTDMDLNGLTESAVDSDDDTSSQLTQPTELSVDVYHDCLETLPEQRTEEHIDLLYDFTQNFPAFSNLTESVRRRLCRVMVLAVVEEAGSVMMNDGEVMDSWSVIINGAVEVIQRSGETHQLTVGDSFGVDATLEQQLCEGVMRTLTEDCQFVCIKQEDFYNILNQGEEAKQTHRESGEVVLVTEMRERGPVVIRGKVHKLVQQLTGEFAANDPTFVEDFLLTRQLFMADSSLLTEHLLSSFSDPTVRDRVTRVLLLWVNLQYSEFESSHVLWAFLEKFEDLLHRNKMQQQLKLLHIACEAKALSRTVVIQRSYQDEILQFRILGGYEKLCGIFIAKVELNSKAWEIGLHRGDQILEVNNHNFLHISHKKALDVLRGSTHLSLTVKANRLGFHEMLKSPEAMQQHQSPQPLTNEKESKSRLNRILQRFTISTSSSQTDMKTINSPYMPELQESRLHSHSNPDLTKLFKDEEKRPRSKSQQRRKAGQRKGSAGANPRGNEEQVLVVYKEDQGKPRENSRFLWLHRDTTAREVVMLALKEFRVNDLSTKFSLYEVVVDENGSTRTKRLPDQLSNLPERLPLNGRYYIRRVSDSGPLIPEELVPELMKSCNVSLTSLEPRLLAANITLQDHELLRLTQPGDYIATLAFISSTPLDLSQLPVTARRVETFGDQLNHWMYWTITEICGEAKVKQRAAIIQKLVKVARYCYELHNFMALFAIMSGLSHSCVSRLHQTWAKVGTKYRNLLSDYQELFNPSRNMSRYRNQLTSETCQPPLVPLFPLLKKDLAFIHLGNDTLVEGLVNFEKLRLLSREIRQVLSYATTSYSADALLQTSSKLGGWHTIKRKPNRVPSARQIYDECRMRKQVKFYLDRVSPVRDEARLCEMSRRCEPEVARSPSDLHSSQPPRQLQPPPSPTSSRNSVPKFGARDELQQNKLISLSSSSKTVKHHSAPHHPQLHLHPHHQSQQLQYIHQPPHQIPVNTFKFQQQMVALQARPSHVRPRTSVASQQLTYESSSLAHHLRHSARLSGSHDDGEQVSVV